MVEEIFFTGGGAKIKVDKPESTGSSALPSRASNRAFISTNDREWLYHITHGLPSGR
jgi:hypothetical protein